MHNVQSDPTYTIGLNASLSLRLSAYGLVLAALGAGIFDAVAHGEAAGSSHPAGLVGVVVLTMVVHELVHGLFFRVYGGRVTYGVGIVGAMPYAYATAPGQPFRLRQMATIGLAPFVLLSLVFLVLGAALPSYTTYVAVAFVANFSGAIGDLWLVSRLVKFRHCRELMVVDHADSLTVHTRDPRAQAVIARMQRQTSRLGSFLTYWTAAGFVLVLLVVTSYIVLSATGHEGRVVFGPEWMPLIDYTASPDATQMTLNPFYAVVGGFVVAALVTFFQRRRVLRPGHH